MSAAAAYRNVLKSAKIAFRDDKFALSNAFTRIRMEFEKGRDLKSVGKDEVENRLRTAHQVAHILRHNLVQGRQVTPADQMKVKEGDRERVVYRLDIDPGRHELGDNQSRFGKAASTPDPCGCHTCIDP